VGFFPISDEFARDTALATIRAAGDAELKIIKTICVNSSILLIPEPARITSDERLDS
jgi:hypothetical protein